MLDCRDRQEQNRIMKKGYRRVGDLIVLILTSVSLLAAPQPEYGKIDLLRDVPRQCGLPHVPDGTSGLQVRQSADILPEILRPRSM